MFLPDFNNIRIGNIKCNYINYNLCNVAAYCTSRKSWCKHMQIQIKNDSIILKLSYDAVERGRKEGVIVLWESMMKYSKVCTYARALWSNYSKSGTHLPFPLSPPPSLLKEERLKNIRLFRPVYHSRRTMAMAMIGRVIHTKWYHIIPNQSPHDRWGAVVRAVSCWWMVRVRVGEKVRVRFRVKVGIGNQIIRQA